MDESLFPGGDATAAVLMTVAAAGQVKPIEPSSKNEMKLLDVDSFAHRLRKVIGYLSTHLDRRINHYLAEEVNLINERQKKWRWLGKKPITIDELMELLKTNKASKESYERYDKITGEDPRCLKRMREMLKRVSACEKPTIEVSVKDYEMFSIFENGFFISEFAAGNEFKNL